MKNTILNIQIRRTDPNDLHKVSTLAGYIFTVRAFKAGEILGERIAENLAHYAWGNPKTFLELIRIAKKLNIECVWAVAAAAEVNLENLDWSDLSQHPPVLTAAKESRVLTFATATNLKSRGALDGIEIFDIDQAVAVVEIARAADDRNTTAKIADMFNRIDRPEIVALFENEDSFERLAKAVNANGARSIIQAVGNWFSYTITPDALGDLDSKYRETRKLFHDWQLVVGPLSDQELREEIKPIWSRQPPKTELIERAIGPKLQAFIDSNQLNPQQQEDLYQLLDGMRANSLKHRNLSQHH